MRFDGTIKTWNDERTFGVELNPEGKKRAKDVLPARVAKPLPVRRNAGPAPWGTASLFTIPAFLALNVIAFMVLASPWATQLVAP